MSDHRHTHRTIQQRFEVRYAYPVSFTHGLFDQDNALLVETLAACPDDGPHRMLVYLDDGVAEAHPQLVQRIKALAGRHASLVRLVRDPIVVPGGEKTKNGWNVVQNIMSDIGSAHLCRHGFVMAVGGGSVLDMVGFAASLVHRGVRLIRVPTTVLAQNDAGVGVKTGMDEHGMKNFVGTFAPPFAVLVDFEFLPTLKDKYWFGGLSESFKVALIRDAALFDFLEQHADAFGARTDGPMKEAVERTAILHLDHIRTGGDPFEFGTARPLDFGHWSAHKLETLSNYRLGHGQAVAIGIALDCEYAQRTGLLRPEESERIRRTMAAAGLPVWDPLLERRTETGRLEVLEGLDEFREHLGGRLTITLPHGIGTGVEVHEMDEVLVEQSIEALKRSVGRNAMRGTAS